LPSQNRQKEEIKQDIVLITSELKQQQQKEKNLKTRHNHQKQSIVSIYQSVVFPSDPAC